MTQERERRRAPRIPVTLTVQYRTGDELHRDLVENQSPGGVFIRTSKPLPIGTELDLVFEVEGKPPIKVRGKVVWERLLGGEPGKVLEGMGVRFEEPVDPRLKGG